MAATHHHHHSQTRVCLHRKSSKRRPIFLIPLFFLSVSSLILVYEGREIPNPPPLEEDNTKLHQELGEMEKVEMTMMMIRNQIGSRPPSCMRRCRECGGGHCQAVQVPVVQRDSQNQRRRRRRRRTSRSSSSSSHFLAGEEEGEASNYKPISWKCKCGNLIFNP